jgi:hypothetical protein
MKIDRKIKALVQIFLVLTLTFFVAYDVQPVYADEENCCLATNSGQFCVDNVASAQCAEEYLIPSACGLLDECIDIQGCCEIEGSCEAASNSVACEFKGGYFTDRQCGELDQCQQKGCVVDSLCKMKTEHDCEKAGGEFRSEIGDPMQCAEFNLQGERGCCASEEDCSYGLFEECVSGEFYGDYCSKVEICDTEYHANKVCAGPDQEDVYWVDSAGNLEEIEDDCNPVAFGPEEKTDKCKLVNGEAKCDSLDCKETWDNPIVDGDGGYRKNGESWCEYQSAVGPGKDLPGTSHYMHLCENGIERAELGGKTAGKRDEICIDLSVYFTDADFEDHNPVWIKNVDPSECESMINPTDCQGITSDEGIPLCLWLGDDEDTKNFETSFNLQIPVAADPATTKVIIFSESSDVIYHEKINNHYFGKTSDGLDYWVEFDVSLISGLYDVGYEIEGEDPEIIYSNFEVDLDDQETDGYCFPLVARGDIFEDIEDRGELAQELETTFKNAILWKYDCISFSPKWKCSKNCDLYDLEFMQATNSICNLYGDYGAGYNILGDYNDNGYRRICESNKCDNAEDMKELASLINFEDYKNAGKGLYFESEISLSELFETSKDAVFLWGLTDTSSQWNRDTYAGIWSDPYTDIWENKVIQYGGPILWAIGIVATVLAVVASIVLTVVSAVKDLVCWIFGCDTDKKDIGYQCLPWKPPAGGSNCEKCNLLVDDGGILPVGVDGEVIGGYECTRAMCNSLGSYCEYDLATKNCYSQPQTEEKGSDVKFRDITFECNKGEPGKVGGCEYSDYLDGVTISGEINEGSVVNLTFDTYNPQSQQPEPADCYSGDSLQDTTSEMGRFSKNQFEHTLILDKEIVTGQENNFYVRCTDLNGYEPMKSYSITFTVAPRGDGIPPAIQSVIPEKGLLPYGDDYLKVSLVLPYEELYSNGKDIGCKFFKEKTADYFSLPKNMECSPIGTGSYSECSGTLKYEEEGENLYYFSCLDKNDNFFGPWPEEGYLIEQTPELNISSIKCPHFEGDECAGTIYESPLEVVINTVGGADDNVAHCEFKLNNYNYFDFNPTDSYEHKLAGINLKTGENKILFKCDDSVGNEARSEVSFIYGADSIPPKIKKVYVENQNLKIITNEHSNCRYYEGEVIFEEGINFTSDSTHTIHTTAYDEEVHFMIECRDRFGHAVGPFDAQVIKG